MTDAKNTVSFTRLPNILKIKENNNGTPASATITISDLTRVTSTKEYTLIINGVKLISTLSLVNAGGNKFYLSNSNSDKTIVAYKLVETLRGLSTLPLNYDITLATASDGTLSPVITIMAKNNGMQFDLNIEGTLIDNNIATVSFTSGTSSSNLLKGIINKVLVEVYQVKNPSTEDKIGSTTYQMGTYLTTLTKEAFGEEVSFDLSPLFSAITDYNTLSEVNLYIYIMNDNTLTLAGIMKDIYFTTGYMVNQGVNYLSVPSTQLAQNVSRGTTKSTINNSILYVYQPTIQFTLYLPFATPAAKTINFKVYYINSANIPIKTTTTSYYITKSMTSPVINLDQSLFDRSFYIDVEIPDVGKLRYNVIKPLKATDEIQRVYWTNSYGGISFFDFTGTRTETRKTKVDYYQQNLFDYYDKDTAQLNKVYNKDVSITVSLSTHSIEKDGTWQFFDLQNSSNAWTYVNGKKYFITITDLKITESQVNDIYTATVEYEYSMGDTF